MPRFSRRGEIPIACNKLTMFVDIQQNLLYYVVAAWEEDFTGYVIDYGSYPDQQRAYFTLRDARRSASPWIVDAEKLMTISSGPTCHFHFSGFALAGG